MPKSGNKLFLVDENGCSGDTELHEPILAAGDHEVARNAVIECARAMGLTEDEIAILYPRSRKRELEGGIIY